MYRRHTHTQHTGALSFWRSNFVRILGFFPSQTLNFALNSAFKPVFRLSPEDSHVTKFAKNIGSGAAAGSVTLAVVYSLDYTRVRLANDVLKDGRRQFKGLIDVYTKTLKSDGIAGLYRGAVVSVLGIIVYRGLYFGLYDTLKPLFGENASRSALFGLGFGVTFTAGLISYPFSTIRCRMLMRSCETVKYRGSLDCARQIIQNEGLLALWRGVSVNIVISVIGACSFTVYNKVNKLYASWH